MSDSLAMPHEGVRQAPEAIDHPVHTLEPKGAVGRFLGLVTMALRSSDDLAPDWFADFAWGVIALLVSGAAIVRPLDFFLDDALFYPQIAYFITKTGKSTFNGLIPTNGYHPLWMSVNVLAMHLARTDRVRALLYLVIIEQLLFAATIVVFARLTRRLHFQLRAPGLALLMLTLGTGLFGLETHLSALTIVAFALQFTSCLKDRANGRKWMLLGFIAALMVLARLDNIFLLVALGPFVISGQDGSAIKRILYTGIPVVALLTPYLIFNRLNYGHIVPISGAVKSSFPIVTADVGNLGRLGQLTAVVAVLALIYCFYVEAPVVTRYTIAVLSSGTLLHALYIVLFSRSSSTGFYWYYAIGIVNSAVVADASLSWLLYRCSTRRESYIRLATYSICIALVFAAACRGWLKPFGYNINPLNPSLISRMDPRRPGFQFKLAEWMNANLVPGSTVLAIDYPGALAYQTNFRVIALDGLVGDYAFNRELSEKGIAAFIAKYRAAYYFGPVAKPGELVEYFPVRTTGYDKSQTVEIHAPLTLAGSGRLRLERSALLIDAETSLGGTGHGHLGIWRLDAAQSDVAGR
jgi:hypothetical protein